MDAPRPDPSLALAAELRKIHAKSGVSLKQLERYAHASDSSLSRYLSGQSLAPWAVVEALCRLEGRDPSTLRGLWDAAREAGRRARTASAEAAEKAKVARRRVRPRNELPRDVVDFTGRAQEIGLVTASGSTPAPAPTLAPASARAGEAVRIVAIDGMAGIGKTALAVHAAHLLTGDYPDGQLYVDLHGHTPGTSPVAVASALRMLLGSLGIPIDRLPESVPELSALWRAELAGRRVLTVLDNAADDEQVRPLLPGAGGCLVLVTSRRRLADLDGVRHVSLDVMAEPDAATLFTQAVGDSRPDRERAASAEVLRLCGHLPLAIRIAAARLRHRPAWTVADLAELLADERSRLAELATGERGVAAAFAVSEQHLDPPHQRVFRLLGLVPGQDFDAFAVAALAELPATTARRMLEDLVDVHLVQQPAAGRYRLHDLMRRHAHESAESSESEPALRAAEHRLLDYYLHTARLADRYLTRRPTLAGTARIENPPAAAPSFANDEEARVWMRAESRNLHAAALFAAATSSVAAPSGADGTAADPVTVDGASSKKPVTSGTAADIATVDGAWSEEPDTSGTAADPVTPTRAVLSHAMLLPAAMLGFLRTQGLLTIAQSMYEAALGAALRSGDPALEAAVRCEIGIVQRMAEDYDAAGEELRRALKLFREQGNLRGEADALSELGEIARMRGEYDAATTHQRFALEAFRTIGDLHGEAESLARLGCVQTMLGDHGGTAESNRRAFELFAVVGDRVGQVNALNGIGDGQLFTGDFPGAADSYRAALELARELGSPVGQMNALNDLSVVLRQTGRLSESADFVHEALDLAREVGNLRSEAHSLHNLGDLQQATGRFAEAEESLRLARDKYGELVSTVGIANVLGSLGDVLRAALRHDEALAILEDTLERYRELESPDGEVETLIRLGVLAADVGDPKTSLTRFGEALDVARSIASPYLEARSLEGLGRLDEALAGYEKLGTLDAERVRELLACENSAL